MIPPSLRRVRFLLPICGLVPFALTSCTSSKPAAQPAPASTGASDISTATTTTSVVAPATTARSSTTVSVTTTVSPPTTDSQVLVAPCGASGVVRPSSIVLACADGNAQVVRLTWTSWGSSGATASGEYAANDCTPTCVGGKFHDYPAEVTLSGAHAVGPDLYFTTLTVHFTASTPFDSTVRSFPLEVP